MRNPLGWMKGKLRTNMVRSYEKKARKTRAPVLPTGRPYTGAHVITRTKSGPSLAEIRLKKRRAANKRARVSRKRNRRG